MSSIGQKLLIIGAQPGSLGEAVADRFDRSTCLTAGMSVHEDFQIDLRQIGSVRELLDHVDPHSILVTAGINVGEAVGQKGFRPALIRSMEVNVVGVMAVLDEWVARGSRLPDPVGLKGSKFYSGQQFVAISSNSAQIARRNSAAYCASKAALSMALRCAARELAGRPLVYGYELGLLKGTPMTAATEARFGPAQSRMVGAEKGLDKEEVAGQIARNLLNPWHGLNGTLLRLDAGEQ